MFGHVLRRGSDQMCYWCCCAEVAVAISPHTPFGTHSRAGAPPAAAVWSTAGLEAPLVHPGPDVMGLDVIDGSVVGCHRWICGEREREGGRGREREWEGERERGRERESGKDRERERERERDREREGERGRGKSLESSGT